MNITEQISRDLNAPPLESEFQKTRNSARDYIVQNDWPNRKNELWKYTSLRKVRELDIQKLESEFFFEDSLIGKADLQISESGWDWQVKPGGLQVLDDTASETYWVDLIEQKKLPVDFSHYLNLAMCDEVKVIEVQDNARYSIANTLFSSSKVRSEIIVHHVKEGKTLDLAAELQGPKTGYKNQRFVFVLEKNAEVTFDHFQRDGSDSIVMSKVDALLTDDSKFSFFDYAGGAKLYRNEMHIDIDGEKAEANLSGLYNGQEQQHIDHQLQVVHRKESSESSQNFFGILRDQSRAVFGGKVRVHKEAQLTNATQINKTLLLSDEAEIDTKPQLEIDADDVKCGHGAAIAQINPDELFYLRSRGFTEVESQKLLIQAFARHATSFINRKELSETLLSGVKAIKED